MSLTPKKSAMIVNALVLPGLGQMMSGAKVKGLIISIGTILFAILPLAVYAYSVTRALDLLSTDETMSRGLVALSTAWLDNRGIILGSLAMVALLWLYSIVDLWLTSVKSETLKVESTDAREK